MLSFSCLNADLDGLVSAVSVVVVCCCCCCCCFHVLEFNHLLSAVPSC